jgi:methyltransferase (TIGR00027 family)
MKPGHESQTAVMVAAARAAAHGRMVGVDFQDPTALALLPEAARRSVEDFRTGVPPKDLRGQLAHAFLDRREKMMVARTVAIDEAVRAAAAPQVVILGAGLDGRAWRMPELRDATVFEVDHPDSQREKQARAAALQQIAREVRFVPVDFTRDRLDDALAAAGHDPARPTTWVWEGVVMYLPRADIEATLAVIQRRSSPGSHLVVMYVSRSVVLPLVYFFLRRVGEPLRTLLTPDQLRVLLAKYGFAVARDDGLPAIAARLSADLARDTRVMKHMHVATAAFTARG